MGASKWIWPSRGLGRLLALTVPVTLFFFANFFSRAIINQVLLAVICADGSSPSDCESAEVSASASMLALYSEIVWNVPALLLSGVYAQLADRVGRRFVMGAAVVGYMQYFGVVAVIAATNTPRYTEIYLVSSFIAGTMGGFNSFNLAAYSYASDITAEAPTQRGLYYSLLDTGHSLAKFVAPLSSGLWADSRGFAQPMGFACAVCLFTLLWVGCCLVDTRESSATSAAAAAAAAEGDTSGANGAISASLNGGSGGDERDKERERARLATAGAGPLQLDFLRTFRNMLFVRRGPGVSGKGPEEVGQRDEEGPGQNEEDEEGEGRRRSQTVFPFDLPVQLNSFFLFFTAYMMEHAVYVLYWKQVFKLSSTEIGAIDSYQGLVGTAGMLLLPSLVRLVGLNGGAVSDQLYVLVGYVARFVFYVCMALLPASSEATAVPRLFAVSSLLLLSGPSMPRSRSVAVNSTPKAEQASVQASFSALQALALLLSIFANLLYSYTVASAVTAVWWLCVALMAASVILCAWQYVVFVLGAGGRGRWGRVGGGGGDGGGVVGDGRSSDAFRSLLAQEE